MENKNYTVLHLHSDISNATTIADSVTKYNEYIDYASSLGMKAMAFSEHGNVMAWYHKKCAMEEKGIKYIHAVEAYVTESLEEEIRDNYHCLLIATNYESFKELNKLVSKSFNRKDGHFYHNPRITIDELLNTSNDIIVCTACIGGILYKGTNSIKEKFIKFLIQNKNRCYLEIQHHNTDSQKRYNKYLYHLSKKYNIPLVACTDTHALNEKHVKGRTIRQIAKKTFFENEDGWDLTFKTYDELIEAFKIQNSLPMDVIIEAIENTNRIADRVSEFSLDKHTKYPKIYKDSEDMFKKKINEAYRKHKYIRNRYSFNEIKNKINEEFDVYKKTKSIDFMLLQNYVREWERENSIQCGYGRGSVSGSEIAYILGITEMDSLKFGLNFFRFMNPSRVTNADIDTDYSEKDRDKVKYFILHDHMNLKNVKSSEIITFNTIAMKGAIREVGRALEMPLTLIDSISKRVDSEEDSLRKEYPELFELAYIINGTIASIGSHPSGVLVSDLNIEEEVGLCSLSTSDYPVSMLNMKELDALMYVKLDILGLDNIGVINETCNLVGIERLTPDNVDLNDEKVWKSIRDDTTLIFQWESTSAQAYLKQFMSDETIKKAKEHNKDFSYIKWFSFGNGLIRPGCKDFRDEIAKGVVYNNNFKELDEFLSITFGHVTMQEDIMQFLVKFCGYSDAESDTVRRGIAKKYGTEKLLPEIERRFIEYSSSHYSVTEEECKVIIKPFLQAILSASSYGFSWNHSDSYSCIGYICGYLRYYYPFEFIVSSLNVFKNDNDKIVSITNYAKKHGIKIKPIQFGKSCAEYVLDKEHKIIYKGIESIKYCNKNIAEELYSLRKNKYDDFVDLYIDIKNKTSVNSKQLKALILLNYFKEFGKNKKLLDICKILSNIITKKQFSKSKLSELNIPEGLIKKYSSKETKSLYKEVDVIGLAKELFKNIENKPINAIDQYEAENEYLGYIDTTYPNMNDKYYYVKDISITSYGTIYLSIRNFRTGKEYDLKIKSKNLFARNPIDKGCVIKVDKIVERFKKRKNEEGKWVAINETELCIDDYSIIKK